MSGFQIFGMSIKFVGCTLGVNERQEFADVHVPGGPIYYLRKGFADLEMRCVGQFTHAFYAVGIFIDVLGMGDMFQSNQA